LVKEGGGIKERNFPMDKKTGKIRKRKKKKKKGGWTGKERGHAYPGKNKKGKKSCGCDFGANSGFQKRTGGRKPRGKVVRTKNGGGGMVLYLETNEEREGRKCRMTVSPKGSPFLHRGVSQLGGMKRINRNGGYIRTKKN